MRSANTDIRLEPDTGGCEHVSGDVLNEFDIETNCFQTATQNKFSAVFDVFNHLYFRFYFSLQNQDTLKEMKKFNPFRNLQETACTTTCNFSGLSIYSYTCFILLL